MSSKFNIQNNVMHSFGCTSLFSTSLGKKQRSSISKDKKINIKTNLQKIKIFSKNTQQSLQQQFKVTQQIDSSYIIQSKQQKRFQYKKIESFKNLQSSIGIQQSGSLQIYQGYNPENMYLYETPKFTLLSQSQACQNFSSKQSLYGSILEFNTNNKAVIESLIYSHNNSDHIYDSQLSIQLQKEQFSENNIFQNIKKQQFNDSVTDVCSPVDSNIEICFLKQQQKYIIKSHDLKNKIEIDDINQAQNQFNNSDYFYSIKVQNLSESSQKISNKENSLRKYNEFSFGLIDLLQK